MAHQTEGDDGELGRLGQLAADHEYRNGLPQRTFLWSTSPSGTERDRKYVFGAGVQLHSKVAAVEYMRRIARTYGLIEEEDDERS